jgi:hypothetical protein
MSPVSRLRRQTMVTGGALRGSRWMAAGLALLGAMSASAPAAGADSVTARVGSITVSATALRPGPSGELVGSLHVSTSGQPSDQLDAATVADGGVVAVYHRQVSVGELANLATCGGDNPPPGVVSHWLHYGPLLVPGRSGGPPPPADATLTVRPPASQPIPRIMAITLYFAQAGPVTLHLPVGHG